MIIINDTLGVYGGTQTLILRMCRWLAGRGESTAVICESTANTEITGQLKKLGIPFHEAGFYNVDQTGRLIRHYYKKDHDLRVISFAWNHYLDAETVKVRHHMAFHNFLYCVHPKTFFKGEHASVPAVSKVYMDLLKRWLVKMNQNRAVIFMDEADLKSSEEYFHVRLSPAPEILRIPMDFPDDPDWKESARSAYDGNIIMTAGRAEFPFKGYLLGLIDDYDRLFHEYPDIRLEIVSSGDDLEELEEKISRLDREARDTVVLHHWMSNDRLKREIDGCKACIGMGTTVLEASRMHRPAIPVRFYTRGNYAEHFAADRPEYLTAPESCTHRAVRLLRQVLSWDEDEYLDACERSYIRTKEVYDENVVLERWLDAETREKDSILSVPEALLHYYYEKANQIRFKNTRVFDYEKLKKED